MKAIFMLLLCFLVTGSSVPIIDDWKAPKDKPDHVAIEPELEKYENSYKEIAAKSNIKFTHRVTIGFSVIKIKKGKGHVIGLCNYGKNFREIDIDVDFWKSASEETKRTLAYHELTHCLCTRSHDWGDGTAYPDEEAFIYDAIIKIDAPFWLTPPGFYKDGCPKSIMYPYILDDDCVEDHWDEYEKEMFNRCNPY